MMKMEFCKPTECDALYIAAHIKPDNRQEVLALEGDHVLEDIIYGMSHSTDIGCLRIDGRPAGIWGIEVVNVLGPVMGWLLFSDEIMRHPIVIGRSCKKYINECLDKYPVIFNYVNAENKTIIKWLRSLGAELKGPFPHGIYNKRHYYFEFRKKEV